MKKRFMGIAVITFVAVALVSVRYHRNNTETIPTPQEEKNSSTDSGLSEKTSATAFSMKSGDYDFSLVVGGETRQYLLHVPRSYDAKKMTPLIMAFHGGTGSAENMRNNYDLVTKSDQEGFIVAFPNGASRFPSGKFATWNAGECCGYATQSKSDDVGFVKAAIADIRNKFNISKIFAAGMSNGGMFSYRLACDMSETFTAIAAVSGTDNYPACSPKNPVLTLHIHSLQDSHVLYNGGCGPDCMARSETEFVSVPDTISKWVSRNKCDTEPKRVFENDKAYCDLYSSCDDGAEVKLCTTKDGGHSWPGLSAPSGNSLEKNSPSQAISATDEIWNFFKSRL